MNLGKQHIPVLKEAIESGGLFQIDGRTFKALHERGYMNHVWRDGDWKYVATDRATQEIGE